MIARGVEPISDLEGFRLLLAAASLPVIGLVCMAAHTCVPEANTAAACIVFVLLLGHVFLVACLAAKNPFLLSVMLASLMLKAASVWQIASIARRGSSDALMYFNQGRAVAASSISPLDVFDPQRMWGTDFIVSITADLIKITGPSFITAMIVFALISFWGPYLYLLAHRQVFPHADPRLAALALFLWPSIIYWSCSIGKDALMLALLGLTTYSRARLCERRSIGQFGLLAVGVCGCFFIRPHIAALLTISLTASFGLTDGSSSGRKTGRRILVLVFMVIASVLAVFLLAQLLQIESLADGQDHLNMSVQSNEMGGSGFNPGDNPFLRVILAPLLLFRPFPWEAAGVPALLASAEGMILLAFACRRRKNLLTALRQPEARGLVIYALWFVALNLIFLGIASSNFGLLARQRVMILPLLLMLLATSSERSATQAIRPLLSPISRRAWGGKAAVSRPSANPVCAEMW